MKRKMFVLIASCWLLVACGSSPEPPATTIDGATVPAEEDHVPAPDESVDALTDETDDRATVPAEEDHVPTPDESVDALTDETEIPLPDANQGDLIEAETAEATAPGEAAPTDTQLPFAEEIDFTIVDQLGGVPRALAVDGDFVYAGFGPRILVIDASDAANPQLLGRSEPLPDLVQGIDVSEGVAYVAAGRAGLILLDVSDPANVRILNDGPNYWTPDEESVRRPWAKDVTVVDDTAYLFNHGRTDGWPSLLRFDIADARQPRLLDTLDLQERDDVLVDGDLIIIIGNRRVQLRDAANPDTILSETPLTGGSYSSQAVVNDHILTMAETGGPGPNGIEQFDLSDPAEPVALGDLVELDIFFLSDHVVTNETVLISAGTFGEFGHCDSTIDFVILEDGSPHLAKTIDPENCITDLAIQDEKLFVSRPQRTSNLRRE